MRRMKGMGIVDDAWDTAGRRLQNRASIGERSRERFARRRERN